MKAQSRSTWPRIFAPPGIASAGLILALTVLAGLSSRAAPVISIEYPAPPGDVSNILARAADTIRMQYPAAVRCLGDGTGAAVRIHLDIASKPGVPAWTSGGRITLGEEWFRAHPDDMGCVVHEMVHVIQSYPGGGPGWLTEGLADYVRFGVCMPDPRELPASGRGRKYTEGYRTTAAFLVHLELSGHSNLVARLNEAMRRGAYREALWRECTGKSLSELWRDFETIDFRREFADALKAGRWPR